ncbi:hypothetical protein EDB81DRAFT_853474 [Dactylonectria macrodidyma]|uniref:Uncharacterized protein n=1 Tax=Dactylonectria macrodidyma TaxID=307937 RepID=A0A9P9FEN8_9HYPO|nr:hypothetical protein EDB81DRAFT_853474 [Dactylonectria macrodidyma]
MSPSQMYWGNTMLIRCSYFNLSNSSAPPLASASLLSPRLNRTPKVPTPESKRGSVPTPGSGKGGASLNTPSSASTTLHPNGNGASLSSLGVDPPRPPRDGFEWACVCPSIPEHDHFYSTIDKTETHHALHSLANVGAWFKDESGTSKLKRKLFGKAPWHRKESGDSFSSVASSVREVLRGSTPPSTPSSESPLPCALFVYASWFQRLISVATVGKKYPIAQFPGGEATRVKTPPLGEYTADGRPRSFFTPMAPPHVDGSDQVSLATSSSRQLGHRRSLIPQQLEWWEHFPQKPSRQELEDNEIRFEFQVPEHLPSSPMCPTNTRHSSGSTGVCVYHRRKRTTSGLKDVIFVEDY